MCAHKKPTNAADTQPLGWGRGATDAADTDIDADTNEVQTHIRPFWGIL